MGGERINKRGLRQRAKEYAASPLSLFLLLLVIAGAVVTLSVLIFLIVYILIKGIPYITPDLFALEYNSENVSLFPAMVNTVTMTMLALVIAAPLGIFSAIYLTEYAKRGSRVVELIRLTTETLSGIPSIVYGLFGMLFFVTALRWGYSMLAGALTLSIMILPLIMRTTEEALLSVPILYREGSFGLGAGKLRTVFRVVLPSAAPGIFAGIVLAIGRIVGESAALVYTSGSGTRIATSPFDSAGTLSVFMYMLMDEGLSMDAAYAVAAVLMIFVFLINIISGLLSRRMEKKTK